MTAGETPGVVAPPPLIYLGALALGFAAEALLPSETLAGAVRWPLGGALLVAGLALIVAFERAFQRASTSANPYRPSTHLALDGPYRFTRNPGYLGMALVFAGICVLSSALWALLGLPLAVLAVDRGVIAREEPYLERRFGTEYVRYKARVRRWL